MRSILLFVFLAPIIGMAQDQTELVISRIADKYELHTGDSVHVMGYTQALSAPVLLPAPRLIFNEGDSIKIDLWNVSQGMPHTIHLHGLDVNQENDGVPFLSWDVPHMEHGYYWFKAPQAGNYLYHCHVMSSLHVQAGMYGIITVRPPDGNANITWENGYAYDEEYPLMHSEIDTTWHHDSLIHHEHDTTQEMVLHLPDYHPQYFLINGKSQWQLQNLEHTVQLADGETGYLRITNIGFNYIRYIFPTQMMPNIVASDGRPIPQPYTNDTLEVFPGERFGVLTTPGTFQGEITVEYVDCNTDNVLGTELIQVNRNNTWIEELPESEIKLFPNPAVDKITFSQELTNVQVRSITGQLLSTHSSTTQIDVSNLDQGSYFIIATHDGTISKMSFIKSK